MGLIFWRFEKDIREKLQMAGTTYAHQIFSCFLIRFYYVSVLCFILFIPISIFSKPKRRTIGERGEGVIGTYWWNPSEHGSRDDLSRLCLYSFLVQWLVLLDNEIKYGEIDCDFPFILLYSARSLQNSVNCSVDLLTF